MKQFLLASAQIAILLIGCGVPIASGYYLTRPEESTTENQPTPSTLIDFEIQNSVETDTQQPPKSTIQVQSEIAQYITQVSVIDENTLAILLNTNQIAILDSNPNYHPLQLKRLEAVLVGFDFSTLAEPIVEIDVRYKLPVLRTTQTIQ